MKLETKQLVLIVFSILLAAVSFMLLPERTAEPPAAAGTVTGAAEKAHANPPEPLPMTVQATAPPAIQNLYIRTVPAGFPKL